MEFFKDFSTFVTIGPISIQWYAIVILTGAFIAYALGQYRFKQLGYNKEILSDYFFALLFIGIIGARIWYVIFTFNEVYISNPLEIFAVWHGGLAIQGGIFTGLIYSYFFFKKRNIPFLVAGDAIMPGVLIAQACGRWGNFFNHEAFGSEVSLKFLNSLHLPDFIIQNMYIVPQSPDLPETFLNMSPASSPRSPSRRHNLPPAQSQAFRSKPKTCTPDRSFSFHTLS